MLLMLVSGLPWASSWGGAAPPPVSGARLRRAIAALVVAGVLLPLFGASLIVLAIVDRIAVAVRRPISA